MHNLHSDIKMFLKLSARFKVVCMSPLLQCFPITVFLYHKFLLLQYSLTVFFIAIYSYYDPHCPTLKKLGTVYTVQLLFIIFG